MQFPVRKATFARILHHTERGLVLSCLLLQFEVVGCRSGRKAVEVVIEIVSAGEVRGDLEENGVVKAVGLLCSKSKRREGCLEASLLLVRATSWEALGKSSLEILRPVYVRQYVW
ncbi:hypothetical protein B0T21DRAFT_347154 [Apiosordaria backusii]|uniref:Uncharacterized protein n=1 Tax=Apiosordaria backusii TaxID=314023 RepID=A0AA40EIB4_9PEZI|nr:hypothetical protein B0T21DRAFT_347154 [Apiosordaria backusii]